MASSAVHSIVVSFSSSADLHENKLTHTDLKPENILFVNSDFTITYNVEKVMKEFSFAFN